MTSVYLGPTVPRSGALNILATSAAFRPARREGLKPSPVVEYAIDLAEVSGRRPKVCVLHTALGDDSRWVAMTYAAFAGHRPDVELSTPRALPDAERRRSASAPAGAGRDLGRRRQRGQPARGLARPRTGRGLPRGLGGGRRTHRRLGRVALLARRRHHRLLRPGPATRHQRAGAAAVQQHPALQLRGAAPPALPAAGGRGQPSRPGSPPTTVSGCISAAPNSSRPSPTDRTRTPGVSRQPSAATTQACWRPASTHGGSTSRNLVGVQVQRLGRLGLRAGLGPPARGAHPARERRDS